MNLWQLFQKLRPFVRPYRVLVIATLVLTLIGSITAQVNALTLQYAVDSINRVVESGGGLAQGLHILVVISAVLLGKEIINTAVSFGQKYYGEKLRILVSQDLAQSIIEKFLRYRLAFFSDENNQAGKLQTRIDRGIASLTRLVQIFFIDILPLSKAKPNWRVCIWLRVSWCCSLSCFSASMCSRLNDLMTEIELMMLKMPWLFCSRLSRKLRRQPPSFLACK